MAAGAILAQTYWRLWDISIVLVSFEAMEEVLLNDTRPVQLSI